MSVQPPVKRRVDPEEMAVIRAKVCYIESLAIERYRGNKDTIHRVQRVLSEAVVRLRSAAFFDPRDRWPNEPVFDPKQNVADCDNPCDDFKCIDPCPLIPSIDDLQKNYGKRWESLSSPTGNGPSTP